MFRVLFRHIRDPSSPLGAAVSFLWTVCLLLHTHQDRQRRLEHQKREEKRKLEYQQEEEKRLSEVLRELGIERSQAVVVRE